LDDGKKIRLWDDIWIGNVLLKERFPRLYSLSLEKDTMISEVGEWAITGRNDVFLGKLAWRRELIMWKEEQYVQLISLTNSIRWKRGIADKGHCG